MANVPPGVGPRFPQVVVLVGATGDLARRKLLPGLFHLCTAGFIPGCRIIGVSLDAFDADAFRDHVRGALDQCSSRPIGETEWRAFAQRSTTCRSVPAPRRCARPSSAPNHRSVVRADACTT